MVGDMMILDTQLLNSIVVSCLQCGYARSVDRSYSGTPEPAAVRGDRNHRSPGPLRDHTGSRRERTKVDRAARGGALECLLMRRNRARAEQSVSRGSLVRSQVRLTGALRSEGEENLFCVR